MDSLRAVATSVAKRAARSRLVQSWRALQALPDDTRDSESGQGLAEYALILALIAIVAVSSLLFLGSTISDLFWAPISEDFGIVLKNLGIG
jgi:Flp pilus assembly pilin Flp